MEATLHVGRSAGTFRNFPDCFETGKLGCESKRSQMIDIDDTDHDPLMGFVLGSLLSLGLWMAAFVVVRFAIVLS